MGFSMTGQLGGGKPPTIAGKGPTNAPPVGKPPKAPPKFTGNPGGIDNPQNNPPRPAATPKPVAPKPKTPGGKVAAAKATGTQLTPLETANPSQISKLASQSAAKIYNPIMAGYNAQLKQAGGLAQKRTADATAFGQWYGQQQQALAAQEQTRQSNLQGLLGNLGTDAATPVTGGITSSDGTNMAAPTGGAAALSEQGSQGAASGILSSQALGNASETNSSQNELTALGGAYQQNMMATISGDLTKSQSTIETAQSKAITDEGTAQSKIDTNLTNYLGTTNKNIVDQNKTLVTGQTTAAKTAEAALAAAAKNQTTSNYDTSQTNNKELSELVALAKTLPTVPPALADRIAQLSGGANPGTGETVGGATAANNAAKNGLAQYEDVTKRLAVNATVTNNKDKNIIATIKNQIANAATGAKVTVSNAEAKYYAARTGATVSQAKADLIKAYAYAAHERATGNTAGGAGVVPYTTDEATTQLGKVGDFQAKINELMSPSTSKGVVSPAAIKNQAAMRKYITDSYGAGGSSTAALAWAAFDSRFYGGLTPRTYTMLQNQGFTKAQLANFKVITPKTTP